MLIAIAMSESYRCRWEIFADNDWSSREYISHGATPEVN